MSYKHIKIEFSIDITEHKRDMKYLQQKVEESLQLALQHVQENGVKRVLLFDSEGMCPLHFRAYLRRYPYCSGTFHSIEGGPLKILATDSKVRQYVAEKTIKAHEFAKSI